MRFDESPLLAIWETTQACDLACVYCRASATPQRHSSELPTEEVYRLLDAIREFGNPSMVFAGGDPLKRPDTFALLRPSGALGLRTNISPSATPFLIRETIWEFRKSGVARMAISLDGPDAATHDGFGGDARRIGLETEIETTVTRRKHAPAGRDRQLGGETRDARVERVLPGGDGPRCGKRRLGRRRVRTGFRKAVQHLAHRAVRSWDQRSHALPPVYTRARAYAPAGYDLAQDPRCAYQPCAESAGVCQEA